MIANLERVTIENIKEATKSFDENPDAYSNSTKYDVLINDKFYPPKEILRIAYKLATGDDIKEEGFSGGEFTNKIFRKLGFQISIKANSINYYAVGTVWYTGNIGDDQTERFITNGIWVNGKDDKKSIHITKEVKKGDLLALKSSFATKQGKSILRVKCIGEVIHNENDGENLVVKWQDDFKSFDIEGLGKYRSTIDRVAKEDIDAIFYNETIETNLEKTTTMEFSLNTILYGPPGTGKTYNTVNKALEIIGYDVENNDRKTIKAAFDKYVKEGQIVFTTFHQSMSYEDFIEGIKPETKEDKVIYNIKDGIFKTIANKAFSSLIKQNSQPLENYVSPTFDQLHNDFLDSIKPFEGTDDFIFKTIYNHDIKLVDINGSTIVVMFRWQDVKKSTPAVQRFVVTKDKLKLLFEGGVNPHTIKSLKIAFAPFMQHNLSVFYAVYKKFYEFIESSTESKTIDEVEIVDDFSFEEIDEEWALKDEKGRKAAIDKSNNYVLIIDEINRANVSQIFGELITLIEDDKRIGNKEELKLTLPYSKKEFGVPPNLYIIGTMNTADRSVEALDTALRRRFVFEEMMPLDELLSPQSMVWKLWWDYIDYDWNNKEYKEIENKLYQFLGFSEEQNNRDFKESLWQPMKSEKKPNKTQIDVLKILKFENGINLQKLLIAINTRIEVLLNRDNLIGHSYFLNVSCIKDLKNAFKNKIIPLLQEYFFGDYGKIGLVLGEGFVIKKQALTEQMFAKFEYEGLDNYLQKSIYTLVDLDNMENDIFKQAIYKLIEVE
jgi:5-methylcytosine-specific restriction enzyme B